MEAYKKFSKELADSLHPETPMETQLAQTIADTQWRLNRARTIEDGMLAMGHFEAAGNFTADSPDIHAALTAAKAFRERSHDFANLSLYEQRLSGAQKEAFRQLRELQAERKAALAQVPVQTKSEPTPLTRTASATARQPQPQPKQQLPKRLGSFVRARESPPRLPRKSPSVTPQTHYPSLKNNPEDKPEIKSKTRPPDLNSQRLDKILETF